MADTMTSGDFEKLVYHHQEIISKVCHIYCHDPSDRADLFQEILINLWKGISSFKGKSQLSTWIYRVSINTAISAYHKQKRKKLILTGAVPDKAERIKDQSDRKERQTEALFAGIEKLKPVEKAIVLLYLEEKSYQEISDVMGITSKNVSVRLARIRKKLEKIVKSLLPEN